jgi:hypothetical protein
LCKLARVATFCAGHSDARPALTNYRRPDFWPAKLCVSFGKRAMAVDS